MGFSPRSHKELDMTEHAMPHQGWRVDFLSLVLLVHLFHSI